MPDYEPRARIEAIGEQLRSKISSKFQTSTFLAGFGFTVLTVQVSTFWQSPRFPYLLPTSISILVVSIVIYIAAVVKLDGLTMPKRFWKEDRSKKDPVAHNWPTSQIKTFGGSSSEWFSTGGT
jgi:hypothetical protein